MTNTNKIADALIANARKSFPRSLEVDHREVLATLDGEAYDATAVRVELGRRADWRERLASAPQWLGFGYCATEAGERSWSIMVKTH